MAYYQMRKSKDLVKMNIKSVRVVQWVGKKTISGLFGEIDKNILFFIFQFYFGIRAKINRTAVSILYTPLIPALKPRGIIVLLFNSG